MSSLYPDYVLVLFLPSNWLKDQIFVLSKSSICLPGLIYVLLLSPDLVQMNKIMAGQNLDKSLISHFHRFPSSHPATGHKLDNFKIYRNLMSVHLLSKNLSP